VNKRPPFHPRNAHQGHYDFAALSHLCPALIPHIVITPRGEQSINFSDAQAVLLLNKALLHLQYQIEHWLIPEGYLCPPIPGRADYIHALADILAGSMGSATEPNNLQQIQGKHIQVLDIGTGASCIYPLIGARSYGWRFTATDIDPISISTAQFIVQHNAGLNKLIKPVLQKNPQHILQGIIGAQDFYHLSMCNPPFYRSLQDAQAANARKVQNLARHKNTEQTPAVNAQRNFGGQKAELWCAGGEQVFIQQIINESQHYAKQVAWFSSLVSDQDNLKPLQISLKKLGAQQIKVVNMGQGQKISRLLAWSFHNPAELAALLNPG
jgi:23S rRNA (adenine1618-N6)-methyltransferase